MAERDSLERVKRIAPTVPFAWFVTLLSLTIGSAVLLQRPQPARPARRSVMPAAMPAMIVTKTPPSPPSNLFIVRRERAQQPVKVLSRLSLGPAAGNGIQPVCAAYDTRRDRLYVLNNLTQNLSVVDPTRHRIVAVWPIPPIWDPINHQAEMLYDSTSDRLFVIGEAYLHPKPYLNTPIWTILSISPDRGQILTRRAVVLQTATYQVFHYPVALSPTRHELYLAVQKGYRSEGNIEVLDTRTLGTKRRFPVPAGILALAVSVKAGRLYTLEPSPLPPSHGAPVVNNDPHRLVARSLQDGRVVARSPDTFDFPNRLIVDARRDRLILLHTTQQNNSNISVVSLLDPRTLKSRHDLILKKPDPSFPTSSPVWPLSIRDLQLDATHDRLIAQTEDIDPSGLAIVDLKGPAGTRFLSLHTPLTSECRLVRALPSTGQIVLLDDNAFFGIDASAHREAWRLPVGADIAQIFLDRQNHRLLADVQTDFCRLQWVQGSRPLSLSAMPPANDPGEILSQSGMKSLVGVDFLHQWIYTTSPSLSGPGAYLNRMSFDGQGDVNFSSQNEGKLHFLALDDQLERRYQIEFPENTDMDEPVAYVNIYIGSAFDKQVAIGRMPNGILYLPKRDQLFVLHGATLQSLDGSFRLQLPRGRPQTDDSYLTSSLPDATIAVDADASGEFLYYADPYDRVLYKIRHIDGNVLATRRLSFSPSALAVDSLAQMIYLVDWKGGSIIRASLF